MEFALKSNTGGVPRVLDRRISNAGSVADIRKRDPQQIFKSGGITKFSTLGSQNAISYVPIAYPPPKKEAGTQTGTGTETGTGTGPDKPLLGKTQSEASKQALAEGLLGTTQSEASKIAMGVRKVMQDEKEQEKEAQAQAQAKADEESANAVEPSEEPPYYLPQEQEQMDAMILFLKQRYGEKETRKEVDFILKDSKNFSSAVEKAMEINKMIYEYYKDKGKNESVLNTLKGLASWVLDKAVGFGTGKIDFGGKGEGMPREIAGGIATEVAKEGINQLKKIIQSSLLKQESYEDTMRAVQNTLFSLKPGWKAKWEKLLAKQKAEARKHFAEFIGQMGGSDGMDIFEKEGRLKNLKRLGNQVIAEYKKYQNKEISIGDWKNSSAREDYDVNYAEYTKKYGSPGFGSDPLKWDEDKTNRSKEEETKRSKEAEAKRKEEEAKREEEEANRKEGESMLKGGKKKAEPKKRKVRKSMPMKI